MSKNEDLKNAWSELGDASASLSFAGYNRLAERARNLQSEVDELINWGGKE